MTQATKKKHVTREVVDNYEFPDENQEIVQVLRGCGNNLHEVVTATGEQYLVSMPTKFRRSIWIKRGDYCVVTPIEEGNKVRAEITTILLKEQIRYFKEHNRWPKEFEDDHLEMTRPEDDAKIGDNSAEEEEEEEEDSDSDLEDDLVPNTNRVYFDESSEEEEMMMKRTRKILRIKMMKRRKKLKINPINRTKRRRRRKP
ncbi:putative RNA-binding protein eif1ad [Tyrophagus putrescentiae]|nr:putative RNA-binding protein eif1ad [Tyrophagus putrescentiae]